MVKAELPNEILATILQYLPVPDLCRAARVSLLLKDLVYDDRRWVQKLKLMDVWSDEQARIHAEDEAFRRQQRINAKKAAKEADDSQSGTPIRSKPEKHLLEFTPKKANFDSDETEFEALHVLEKCRSIRGTARREFAKIWVALYPLYEDLTRVETSSEAILFKRFRLPEDQARMLRQLVVFGQARAVDGWQGKNDRIASLIILFENAALREFEIAYDDRSEAKMKKYAGVLDILESNAKCIKTFCSKNVLFTNTFANPLDCFDSYSDENSVNLAPMGRMTDGLIKEMLSQKGLIDRIFGHRAVAWTLFVEEVFSQLLSVYVNRLIDYAQQQSMRAYLLTLTGSYQHLLNLVKALDTSGEAFLPMLQKIYEEHVSLYLEEEITILRTSASAQVTSWSQQIKNESQQTEDLFLSGINREVAKKNFLQSFTKVILMPVNVVGSVMPFPQRPAVVTDNTQPALLIAGENELPEKARSDLPTTELAARAAIMNSGLARIKRLLSLEVALKLIHYGKESIDRARTFISFSGRTGEEAREQCETMFNIMLQALGTQHIQGGFELALTHLKSFNPRHNKEIAQVQPLVDFLELVHVGDLIQQMVDVFYNQELSGIVDKTDFLSPAVKEKKKFEQMIDERVAEGLNRGIDVLMDQVDYILVTTQKPTDFKPWLVLGKDDHLDLNETGTAVAVVDCLKTHTELLRGSTDKSTLDVFFQEVGVRFFNSLCKHFKRQSITVEGGLKLISDLNYYHRFISSLRQSSILPYFSALKELGNIYIISGRDGKAVGQVISDIARFGGILRPEEVYEFAERRADWPKVKKHVDRVIYGTRVTEDCLIM